MAEMSAGIAVERCLWWLDWGSVFGLSFLVFRRPRRLLVATPAVVIAGGGGRFNFPIWGSSKV